MVCLNRCLISTSILRGYTVLVDTTRRILIGIPSQGIPKVAKPSILEEHPVRKFEGVPWSPTAPARRSYKSAKQTFGRFFNVCVGNLHTRFRPGNMGCGSSQPYDPSKYVDKPRVQPVVVQANQQAAQPTQVTEISSAEEKAGGG